MKIIKLINFTKRFKKYVVLSNVNLELDDGKIYGIIGVNGSGKTVLLKSIAGLTRPTKGKIEVMGESLHGLYSFPKDTGIIIEKPGFIPYLTAFENLKLLAMINKKISDAEIKAAIERVGLDPSNNLKVKNYSLGMNQRLGLAQAIMEKPNLLLLDEPFNAIDIQSIDKMRDIIRQEKERGVTILLTSHNKEDIDICDELYEISMKQIHKV